MGVLNCKTNFNNDDKMNRQVITITFDSTIISSEHIVETLIDLGLDAKIDQINSTSDRDDASSIICRSSFYVRGICCAIEVPIVTNILRTTSRTAVKKVSINITARAVYVDHDPNIISATHLAECLTKEGFTSIVTRDGGDVQIRKGNLNELGLNKNQVDVKKILRASRSEAVEDSDAVFQLLEENDYLYQKVRFVSPHIASRTINIERDPLLESAQHVANYTNLSDLSDNKLNGMSLPASKSRAYGSRKRRVFRVLLPKHLGTNIVLSGLFWIISLIGALFDKFYYLKYAGLFSVLFGLPSVAMKALRTVKRWHFDANCMMTIAALGALALQEYDEAASVSFLFAISDLLEDQATIRARKALDTIVNLRPDHANLIDTKTGQISIISTHDLLVGSLVSVRTGDKIPSDGVVVEGESYVDESSLTGESIHMLKTAGSHVSGGTINVGSTRLVVKTTSLVEDSAVSRLVRLVEESASNRSPTEQIVDNFARSYTPFVICLAVIMCTFPWAFGAEAGRHWTLNGLIIVVIACPCALTISTPVTYAAGLAATAQKGIIVKGGSRLEALGAIKTIVFDKTGTLTEGRFRLNHLDVIGTHKTRHQILELLASMESHSSHPLAAALVHAAKQEGVHILNNGVVLNHTVLKGEGVMATVDGVEVYVGNSRLFQRIKLYDTLPSTEKEKALVWSEEGGTVGFLGIPGVGIMAMFCVADCVRKEAKGIISALLDDGVNVLMLTGDSHSAAKVVASEIGLPEENIRSHFLPEDKLHFVSSLLGVSKRKGHLFSKKELLLFCGDGINDAPALSIADVGVAMGEGAELAMETSDVTLMDSNLTKLLFSMKIGAEVIVTVQENIAISVTVKLIVIALTFAGKMTLLAAISSDVGVMLLVSINGMKLLPGAPRRCCKMRRNYAKTPIQPTILSEIV
jgi:Cd2+/Zn2+-exporting ATPase